MNLPSLATRTHRVHVRAALLVAALSVSCGGDGGPADSVTEPPPPPPSNVATAVAGGSQSKNAGNASDEMQVRITTSTGTPVANITVNWTATGGTLASASSSTNAEGLAANSLTSVGTSAGTVTVTAAVGSVKATFTVLVSAAPPGAPAALAYGPHVTVVEAGGTSTDITSVVRDANGTVLSGETISYESRTPSVATVTSSGQIVGVARGQAIIVASVAGDAVVSDSLLAVVAEANGPVVFTDLPRFDIKPDSVIDVVVQVDMRSGTMLGSGKLSITWDPAVLTYQSDADGSSGVEATVNATQAGEGTLLLAFANATGFSETVEMRTITFRAASTSAQSGTLGVAANELFAATTYADLLPQTVSVATPLFTR